MAVEVFKGNTADPATLPSQIQKIRTRFAIERVVLVGDRGMITSKRIQETLRGVEGLEWITALRSEAIRKLLEQGTIQLSLFDERDLVEVQSPEYPGERLVVCRNPLLAEERARKRNELLAAMQKQLDEVVAATQRAMRPLRGKDKIGLRVGKIINRYKVGKHFLLDITEERFSYQRTVGRPSSCTCVCLHVGLPRGVAHAAEAGAPPLRRGRQGCRAIPAPLHRGSGAALAKCETQRPHETH